MPASDLELLNGAWQIVQLEMDGKPVPSAMFAQSTIVVDGSRFTTNSMGAEYSGKLTLNARTKPKTLALHFETGPETGRANHGIYELTGDEWRICLATNGGPAPSEFKSSSGTSHALEVLRRAKAAVQPANISSLKPVAGLQGVWSMVSCVLAGEPLPAGFAKSGRRTIKGLDFELRFGPKLHMAGHIAQDDDGFQLLNNGVAQLGIYKLDKGQLKTCTAAPGRPRPTEYKSTKDGGETYAVWKLLES